MHEGHDHSHGHNHNHKHENTHGYVHKGTSNVSPKDLALLKYMLEHNKQHARELAETGGRLADAGVESAAELIKGAVHYFDHANENLEKAVSLIDGGAA